MPHGRRRGNRTKKSDSNERPRLKKIALLTQVSEGMLRSPIYFRLTQRIIRLHQEDGHQIIMVNLPKKNPHKFVPTDIDAAILFHINEHYPKLYRLLRKIACIDILGDASEPSIFDRVSYDPNEVGSIAAHFLYNCGHRCAAYVSFGKRASAFKSIFEEMGGRTIELNGKYIINDKANGDFLNKKAFDLSAREISMMRPRPTAIFTSMDMLSAGFFHALRAYDLEPMKDIDIIGVNDDKIYFQSEKVHPHTIDLNIEKIAKLSAERLRWRHDHLKELTECILVPPKLLRAMK